MSLTSNTGVTPVESSQTAMAWGPIIGGAVAATGITLILLLLGSGFGLTMVSPWSGESSSAATVGVTAAIWLIVVQWLSSALGDTSLGDCGQSGPRFTLMKCFSGTTAHGFLSWALATILVMGFPCLVANVPCWSRSIRCWICRFDSDNRRSCVFRRLIW